MMSPTTDLLIYSAGVGYIKVVITVIKYNGLQSLTALKHINKQFVILSIKLCNS